MNKVKPKVVLVIEDDRLLYKVIEKKLAEKGLKVVAARSVAEAWDYLQGSGTVDAVWLDHYLLGPENGLDMVARMKSDDRYRGIPVFLVSNSASDDKINSYIQLGVKNYFAKINHRLSEIIAAVSAAVTA
jgi:CheY-like chemotaxis protein